MLIALRHRFVFVANRHAASQTIAKMLAPFSEINRSGSPIRRCIGWSDIRPEYQFLFGQAEYNAASFFKFGVIRDPVDWVLAFYRSRAQPGEPGHEAGAEHIGFEAWWESNAQALAVWDQARLFADFNRSCAMDLLVPFEFVDQTLTTVQQQCKLPALAWPPRGPQAVEALAVRPSAPVASSIRHFFAEATSLHETWMKRWQQQHQEAMSLAAEIAPVPAVVRAAIHENALKPGSADIFRIAGVVMLQADAGLHFRLEVVGAEEVGRVQTGIASAWFGQQHPGHAQAAQARFVIDGLRVARGATVRVRLGVGPSEWDWLTLRASEG